MTFLGGSGGIRQHSLKELCLFHLNLLSHNYSLCLMATRSGLAYQGTMEQEGSEEQEVGVVDSTSALLNMVMRQQELAREQYERALEQQASQQDMLVRLVENQREQMERCREEMCAMRRREADAAAKPKLPKPTLQKLGDKEDIENFLASFERIAKQQEWPRNVWATQLAGLLTGKALAAYAAMTTEDSADYEKVKAAVLHRYQVNAETHCLRFRQEKKRVDELYRAWVCRATDHFDKWMKDKS